MRKATIKKIKMARIAPVLMKPTMEPYRIYLTCFRVLSAIQDPRAGKILADANTLLQERGRISPTSHYVVRSSRMSQSIERS